MVVLMLIDISLELKNFGKSMCIEIIL